MLTEHIPYALEFYRGLRFVFHFFCRRIKMDGNVHYLLLKTQMKIVASAAIHSVISLPNLSLIHKTVIGTLYEDISIKPIISARNIVGMVIL